MRNVVIVKKSLFGKFEGRMFLFVAILTFPMITRDQAYIQKKTLTYIGDIPKTGH